MDQPLALKLIINSLKWKYFSDKTPRLQLLEENNQRQGAVYTIFYLLNFDTATLFIRL